MPKKRETPPEEYERLAERLNNENPQAGDKDDYDRTFKKYFEGYPLSESQKNDLRERTWQYFEAEYINEKKSLFKQAGGKSLRRDRLKTAKVVTQDRNIYIKRGAPNIDFKGLDTKNVKFSDGRNFNILGQQFNKKTGRYKTVFVTMQKLKNGQIKYRTKNGQFARRKQ